MGAVAEYNNLSLPLKKRKLLLDFKVWPESEGQMQPQVQVDVPVAVKEEPLEGNLTHVRIENPTRSESPLECPECRKPFSSPKCLKVHVRRHVNKKTGRYRCDTCSQTFSQRSGQVSHVRVHTQERPYACHVPDCCRSFSDFSTFSKHKRVHSGEKPYGCPQCDRRFTQSGNMHRHVRVMHWTKAVNGYDS